MARILALLGSGENSPAMVTMHQKILANFGKNSKRVLLDTPSGFQENSAIIVDKINNYFDKGIELMQKTKLEEAIEIFLKCISDFINFINNDYIIDFSLYFNCLCRFLNFLNYFKNISLNYFCLIY